MSSLRITNLRCEYQVNPLGIDVAHPRFNWQMLSDQRGARQTAYQVLVAGSERDLSENRAELWDSGKVESDQSIHVVYNGQPLRSGQRAWWKVRVWDEHGNASAESASAWWEMGLLDRNAWHAQWIGAGLSGGPHTSSPCPLLRKAFTLSRTIASARLYATALGLYEFYCNGQRVGTDVFTPGWTDYHTRIQYQVYDVTELLTPGSNVLGAILGDGWYCGHIAWSERQRYGDRPKLLAQLTITFDDGTTMTIATDETWQTAFGPILESDLLMGESYDSRRELRGWSKPGFKATGWLPVERFVDPGVALVAMRGPVVRHIEELFPVDSPREIPAWPVSRWIFDLGQNMVGRVRLKVSGAAGTTITLRHAEVLNSDGTIHTENLRTAKQTDHYTLCGDGEEIYEPHFTFHGFRYVEISGFPGTPTADTITGIVLHSNMPPTGTFECSDPLVNQLQRNIIWGQRGNYLDVPTDCPQRNERLGWTGDAQVFIRTATFNMDVAGFFTKWVQDLADAQRPNGAYPAVAPSPILPGVGEDGGPAWADAGIICPWTIYLCYGDQRLLESHYESMRCYLVYLERSHAGYIRGGGYGDWLALDGSNKVDGGTPKDLIGTAFFAYSARLMTTIARLLGKDDDARHYERLFEDVRRAFIQRFVTPDGLVVGQTQTAYVLALHFGLLPEQLRPVAVEELVRDIEHRGMHLSTGFVGTPYLPHVLTAAGRLDIAYELLHQHTWPSWLYPVTQGATTIWERWDGWTPDKGFQDVNMNSFNHYAYGAIGAWLYAVVAGIDIDPARPGYKHIVLRPRPGGSLTSSRATYDSLYGQIVSDWRMESGRFEWTIAIPPNTTAIVYVPAELTARITESGQPAHEAPGINFLRAEADATIYTAEAGHYHFAVTT